MLCSLWENKYVVCFDSHVAWAEVVCWPPSHCRHCTIYVLHKYPLVGTTIKKIRIQIIYVTPYCFLTQLGSHRTLLPDALSCSCRWENRYIAGRQSPPQASYKAAKGNNHKQQPRGACQVQTLGSGWGPRGGFESLWSSLCSNLPLVPHFETSYEIKPLTEGENTASISQK